jgi:Glycine zipper
MMTRLKRLAVLVCGATFFSSLTLTTAQPYIYPNQGQSPQQEQFDKGQCYSWAVQQSGFDPANPQVGMAPPPGMQAPQGGMFRGAAGGAAMGAIGGAIGGDAGEGAAIGAGVGALFGAMRRARYMREEEQMQQSYVMQQQSAMSQGRSNYERAFSACMAGRGYTVR